jgi:acetyl/propionyl-CoA carboxylase alpha subunit
MTPKKILIANRGEIAMRIMATCRRMGIATVAVFSDPDEHSLHARNADEAVHLPGTTAAETYLRGEAIIAAAQRTGATAIHPGYGFLSENPEFAEAVASAGLTFIGPPPEAIAAMGSKLEAKRLMDSAGVPTLTSLDAGDLEGEALVAAAEEVGFPLLVKAVAGGGGKGMRIVTSVDGLAEAVTGARREAESAFADGRVFLERYLEAARHIEIQVLADVSGDTVSLFERECSIQRRYQKIIEEAPSPAVDDELRERMGDAAVAAARAVGYVGAGTVEFLVAGDEFAFLEMNTRLQVEHPVTELITGLDLVREQIHIAAREPLSPEARDAVMSGHAIEARLYAEDPSRNFLPVTGTLERFHIGGAVRVDTGVADGSDVSVFYDPLLAKVIAHGATRDDAATALSTALADAEIYGLVTNREMLVHILDSADFRSGATDTALLDRMDLSALAAPLTDDHRLHAVAATLAGQAGRRAATPVLRTIPSGWRNAPSQLQIQEWAAPGTSVTVGYRFGRDGLVIEVDGIEMTARLHRCTPELVDLSLEGIRRTYRVHRLRRHVWVSSALGHTAFVQISRFRDPEVVAAPGSLRAPMPGKVVALAVEVGSRVAAGDPVVVIEAMKMEHTVRTPQDGVVISIEVVMGDQVEADQQLAVVASAEDAG